MSQPIFLRVQDRLVNISMCEEIFVDGETLFFVQGEETVDIVYPNPADAKRAFEAVQQTLTSKGLCLGAVS